jgi:hypothetical protein
MRLFTPSTARDALVVLRPVAERVCRLMRVMSRVKPERRVSDERVDPSYFDLLQSLLESMGTLQEAGVQIKDPMAGLLDFPARRAGRVVLLCWRVGEPRLDHWHEMDAGLAGRQPVDEDGPWEEERGVPPAGEA